MIRRKPFVIIITLVTSLMLFFTGCSVPDEESVDSLGRSVIQDNNVSGLILLSDTFDEDYENFETYILYDSETLVMYALVRDYWNTASAFGFFNLVDADGKPRLYNGKEKEDVRGLKILSKTYDKEHKYFETYILYDSETSVMYTLVRDYYGSATAFGTSVLLNADGTPRLYKP